MNISRRKYETIQDAIAASLSGSDGMTYTELVAEVSQRVGGSFEGSVSWYVVAVKQDMEARGLLGRVPGTRPQVLRLVNGVSSAGAVGCLSTPRPRSPGVFTHRVIAASAASLCGDS